MADDEIVGMLRGEDVTRAVLNRETDLFVSDLMQPHCPVVEESWPLSRALEQMQRGGCTSVAVMRKGSLAGVLSIEQLGYWAALHSALDQPARIKKTQAGPSGTAKPPVKPLASVPS